MRIGLAQWRQESNTFNPVPTTLADYRRFGFSNQPSEIRRLYHQTDELGGFFAGLAHRSDLQIVPLLRAVAWSGGPLTAEAHQRLLDHLLTAVQQARPLDGLLLSLHGATCADGVDDVAGEAARAVRQAVGRATRMVVTLDLHANVTATLLRAADLVVGYQTTPHLDVFETGERAAAFLLKLLAKECRPTTALRRLPALYGLERQSTQEGPLGELAAEMRAAEAAGECLLANLYPVQPWLDVPDLASSVVVATDGDGARANELADRFADRFWELRDELSAKRWAPDRIAIKVAATEHWPLIISDAADATNSGAPGDSTVLLRALINSGTPGPNLLCMVDPLAAEMCGRAGVGCSLTLPLGGKFDPRTGPPVTATGVVRAISDGRYTVSGHGGQNVAVDAGLSVAFETGESTIAICSHAFIGSHPKVYRSLGLEPSRARAVVVKSPQGFRHDYRDIAAEVLWADCPGAACCDFTRLSYNRVAQPLFPLAPITDRCTAAMDSQGLTPG